MRFSASTTEIPSSELVPSELVDLMDRVMALPASIRDQLEPAVAEAIEQARFRSRVLVIARDALERLRLDLTMTQFDLEITRKERDELREFGA